MKLETYPLPEVAFVLGERVKDVRQTVDRNQIHCHLIVYGGRKVRAVDYKTLVFLSWAREHRDDLKPALWRKLYEELSQHSALPIYIDTGVFRASLSDAARLVDGRLKVLGDLEGKVERNAVGDAVLRGTTIEVHRIAALLDGGMSIEEVAADYPSLDADQVAFAQAYAAAHPKAGRPFPKMTAKAALRQTDFSSLDRDD